MHLSDNVATTDQLTINPQLRESWPVGIRRKICANVWSCKNINISKCCATSHQSLGRALRETTLRRVWRAFHVQQNRVASDLLFNCFDDIHNSPRHKLNALSSYGL